MNKIAFISLEPNVKVDHRGMPSPKGGHHVHRAKIGQCQFKEYVGFIVTGHLYTTLSPVNIHESFDTLEKAQAYLDLVAQQKLVGVLTVERVTRQTILTYM